MQKLSLAYETETSLPKAQALALQLGLPINQEAKNQVFISAQKLELRIPPFLPLSADFSQEHWQKRHEAGKKQGLVRAVKPKAGLTILDATAGWGKDAAILASFGAEVTMLERNPIMAAVLQDALDRQDENSKRNLSLQLIAGDAIAFLNSLPEAQAPDLIYIDPMHPERQKSAKVKKELQVLQELIGADLDAARLLSIARQRARQKVVVKWPAGLPPLAAPSSSVVEKTVRFDVYLCNRVEFKL